MNNGQFKSGPDERRFHSGRTISTRTVQRKILRSLGPHADEFIEKLKPLALAGDPGALMTCCILLGAAISTSNQTDA